MQGDGWGPEVAGRPRKGSLLSPACEALSLVVSPLVKVKSLTPRTSSQVHGRLLSVREGKPGLWLFLGQNRVLERKPLE